ncbi:MAG: 3-deoxy-8-phosphooctulonate synthase [Nitrospinaceae bacterium]|nr:3-deoxy-8-phosphooctulonate synthase [Nitrospinaceae bacterium]NIR54446.1 3-deoxy-8-phosphooctulonate synthase [Nitrospinaceae bacterium]NIS84865.1 3-deoxy-8-phosphooctulonate synthase [Nitrospinaceae bacterium]NIT81677.1 3-deoxy-8-phosphooctulonate synthase [Nitrospinaceae bacterium]NIU43948.1 3-deoxy-8-phosphooctulonate synthase [Nitrospinaceae bacterium]
MNPHSTPTREVAIGPITVGGGKPIAVIAGPCVIESEKHALKTAGQLKRIFEDAGIPFIYKSSYDKANRSSIQSFRGPGLADGLRILNKVKEETGVPVLSDVHKEEEVDPAAAVLDVLQIPAFLCRQTDLVVKAAKTGKPVNVKKGQFLAPWDMKNVVDKFRETGNENIMLTERGFMFGYNNMVVDMRSLVLMRDLGYPVVFDCTHSLQLPGGQGTSSGGQRDLVPHLTRGAVAVGCDMLFMEAHPDPDSAPSDGPNMLKFETLPALLQQIKDLDQLRLR